MKKLFVMIALASQIASGADRSSQEFDLLAKKADQAGKGIDPQRIFDQDEAKAFAQAIEADVRENHASAVINLLRRYEYDSPSWQITAKTVSYSPYGGAGPTYEGRKTLEDIFTATIKPGEHLLYYSSPRGWTVPFSLRWHLASWMTENVYQISAIVDNDLLREDPAAWLAKHGIAGNDLTPTPPGASGRNPKPSIGAPGTVSPTSSQEVQRQRTPLPVPHPSAISAPLLSESVPTSNKEDLQGHPFRHYLWITGGVLVLLALAGLALKKRR